MMEMIFPDTITYSNFLSEANSNYDDVPFDQKISDQSRIVRTLGLELTNRDAQIMRNVNCKVLEIEIYAEFI